MKKWIFWAMISISLGIVVALVTWLTIFLTQKYSHTKNQKKKMQVAGLISGLGSLVVGVIVMIMMYQNYFKSSNVIINNHSDHVNMFTHSSRHLDPDTVKLLQKDYELRKILNPLIKNPI